MRYELLLQAASPGVPFETEKVEQALAARKLEVKKDGTRVLPLPHGDVELAPLREGGVQVALELRVPLTDQMELIREALVAGDEVAILAGVRLYDLQLNRPVTVRDEGAVSDQYLRTATYAGDMVGVSAAITLSVAPADDRLLKPGTKVVLGLVAFFAALFLLLDRLTS